jgi:hypothetical protein
MFERMQAMMNRAVFDGFRHHVQDARHGIDHRSAGNSFLDEADVKPAPWCRRREARPPWLVSE